MKAKKGAAQSRLDKAGHKKGDSYQLSLIEGQNQIADDAETVKEYEKQRDLDRIRGKIVKGYADELELRNDLRGLTEQEVKDLALLKSAQQKMGNVNKGNLTDEERETVLRINQEHLEKYNTELHVARQGLQGIKDTQAGLQPVLEDEAKAREKLLNQMYEQEERANQLAAATQLVAGAYSLIVT